MTLLPPELSDPVIIAAIGLIVALAYHYQAGLTYREYTEIQRFKPRVFAILDVFSPGGFRSFVHEKEHPENEDEYYTTTNASPKTVWRRLKQTGFSPHLISSTKRRPDGSLSKWHFVYDHGDGTQTEVYMWVDGTIYAHHETIATDVEGHLSDGITPGDPRGVLDGVQL